MKDRAIVKDFYVYVHRRKTDDSVFYVGKGSERRAWSKTGRNKHWQRIVAKYGYYVEIVECQMQEWWSYELEIALIAYYGLKNLANLNDGGGSNSGYKATEESKRKRSNFQTGRRLSLEKKAELKEKYNHPKMREIMRQRAIERNKNPKHIEKMKQSCKNRWQDTELRKKLSLSLKEAWKVRRLKQKFTKQLCLFDGF